MKNLFNNYVALGEAVMEKIAAVYISSTQIVNMFDGESEELDTSFANIGKIEKRIQNGYFRKYLPHVMVDNENFLKELKALAERNIDDTYPLPCEERVVRKVWSLLDVTLSRAEDISLNEKLSYEPDLFVQRMCDIDTFEADEEIYINMKMFFDKQFELLDEDERRILTLKFGLSGEPCMTIFEIKEQFDNLSLFDTMSIERNALVKLFREV